MKFAVYKHIGSGNTSDVFDIGEARIIKLFHNGYPQKDIEKEFRNSLLMNQTQLPIARVYEMVSSEGRTGLICDKVPGEPLLDIIIRTGEAEKFACILASLHKQLLQEIMPAADDFKKNIRYSINRAEELTVEGKEMLLELLDTLPSGESLCHGDFHYSNVLWDGQQASMIDFMDVCKGHRNFDIARTLYLTEFPRVPDDFPNQERVPGMQKAAAETYLREMGVTREELTPFLMVTAARSIAWLAGAHQQGQKAAALQYLRAQGIPTV